MWYIYGSYTCPYCVRALELAENKAKGNYKFVDVYKMSQVDKETLMTRTGNYRYIPKIFKDTEFIGGYSEMQIYF